MVFLIFTRANLYLGINGRITELLPFGDRAYLSLGKFSFPDDMENILEIVHNCVEAYFDRTAFGMPSNIGLLVVYSDGVDKAIKLEIHNEFEQILPAGWIWERGLLNATDYLDSESTEELQISFRRLINSLKINNEINHQPSWNLGNSVDVQVLEQLTVAPPKPSPIAVFKNAIPSEKYFATIPNAIGRISIGSYFSNLKIGLQRLVPSMPEMPSLPQMPSMPPMPTMPSIQLRKLLVAIPALIIIIALGALMWPEGNGDRGHGNKEPDLITSVAKSQPTKKAGTVPLPIDSIEPSVVDTVNSTASELPDPTEQLAETNKDESLGEEMLTANNAPTNNSQIKNRTDRSAEQPTQKTAVEYRNEGSANELASAEPESIAPIGIKTSNTDQSNDKSNSSLSLSDYAQHSQPASFSGGEGGVLRYLALNVRYPKAAKRKKITGNVVVRFDIDVEGRVSNPVVVNGIGFGCDEEAIRLVKSMPLWKPATQMRKRILSTHTVSVPFN